TKNAESAEITAKGLADGRAPDEEILQSLVEKCLEWLHVQGGGEHGVTILPTELASHPDHVIRLLTRLITMSAPKGQDVDIDFLEKLVLLVCAMAPHAIEERDTDLRVLRLFAGQCAT